MAATQLPPWSAMCQPTSAPAARARDAIVRPIPQQASISSLPASPSACLTQMPPSVRGLSRTAPTYRERALHQADRDNSCGARMPIGGDPWTEDQMDCLQAWITALEPPPPVDTSDPCPGCECEPDEMQECYAGRAGTIGNGACVAGEQVCDYTGVWNACEGQVLPSVRELPDARRRRLRRRDPGLHQHLDHQPGHGSLPVHAVHRRRQQRQPLRDRRLSGHGGLWHRSAHVGGGEVGHRARQVRRQRDPAVGQALWR